MTRRRSIAVFSLSVVSFEATILCVDSRRGAYLYKVLRAIRDFLRADSKEKDIFRPSVSNSGKLSRKHVK